MFQDADYTGFKNYAYVKFFSPEILIFENFFSFVKITLTIAP